MRSVRLAWMFCLFFLAVQVSSQAQTSSQLPTATAAQTSGSIIRDPQAIAVLNQALSVAGGAQALSAVLDYTASGTATYYWGGEGVQGPVTVKGRGTGQFRVDAALSSGVYKFVVNNGTGSITTPTGESRPIQYHNAINFGSLTFPFAYLAGAPLDASTSISYIGLETVDGTQVHHIRAQKIPAVQNNLTNLLARLTTRDFYIDPNTFQVVSTLDMVHPKDASNVDIPHKIQFSNYQPINGILVPFSIIESVWGQRTSSIELNHITFNGGLTDSDF